LVVSIGSINQTFTFYRFFGDFTASGTVNAADLSLLSANFNHNTTSSDWYLDSNGDGVIDGTDYGNLASNYGQTAPGSFSGPILWNAHPAVDLYYSNQWQVLEEDTTPTGGIELGLNSIRVGPGVRG
jgi:hypothetical protein